jgi:hypothetical protein
VAMRKEIHGEPPHMVKLRGSIMTVRRTGKAEAMQTAAIPMLL